MHLLLTALAIALVVFALTKVIGTGGSVRITGDSIAAPRRRGEPVLAFISHGKIFYRGSGQKDIREMQSPYIQGVMDRMERSRQLHGWKQGTTFGVRAMGGGQQDDDVNIQASSLQFASPDRMLYFLKDDSFGGLFEQSLADGTEKRLLHKQNLSLEDMCINADGSKLLCAQHGRNGAANIAMVNVDGRDYRELTGGDTLDSAPAWIPEKPEMILFQSSGIARNKQGGLMAYGPSTIQMLDTKQGALSTVLEDPQTDFLAPRVGANGYLYFIRRPYEAMQYGAQSALVDALLFPFRLLRAIFHYLNFFSMMYTRKPLTTATGPTMQGDLKDMVLKGKRMDAEAALRRGVPISGVPSLVPASWQLVCRSPRGEEQVLAAHVASFSITADGAVLFSNGYGIFALDGANAPEVLLRDRLIADVVAG